MKFRFADRFTLSLIFSLSLLLAACGGGAATSTPANPTRGPLPTLGDQPWRILAEPITRATAARLQPVGTLREHVATVNRLIFSPDSRYLVSIDGLSTANLYDLSTGGLINTISTRGESGEGDTPFAFFNADGTRIVTLTTQVIRSINAADGTRLEERPLDRAVTVAVRSSGGTLLAVGAPDGSISLYDMAAPVGSTEPPRVLTDGQLGSIRALAFSPDDRHLAAITSDRDGPLVRIWRVEAVPSAAAATGAASASGTVSPSEAARVGELRGFTVQPRTLVYSPDGALLAAGGRGEVLVAETSGYTRRYSLTGEQLAADQQIAFSPDSRLFAALGTGDFVFVWTAQNGTLTASLPKHNNAASWLAWSPDGSVLMTTVVTPSTGAYIWPVDSFLPKQQDYPRGTIARETNGFLRGVFSPDGQRLILADASGALLIYGIPRE